MTEEQSVLDDERQTLIQLDESNSKGKIKDADSMISQLNASMLETEFTGIQMAA